MKITVKVKQEVTYYQDIEVNEKELEILKSYQFNEIDQFDKNHGMLSEKLDLIDVYEDGSFIDFEIED